MHSDDSASTPRRLREALASRPTFSETFRTQPGSIPNMKANLALLALVAASLTACISSKETVYRETERVKVEFENDAAARIFYEAFTKSPESRQRNEKTTTFNIPVIIHTQRTEKDSENTAFNSAARRCDTNADGKITEQEARIYAAQQK